MILSKDLSKRIFLDRSETKYKAKNTLFNKKYRTYKLINNKKKKTRCSLNAEELHLQTSQRLQMYEKNTFVNNCYEKKYNAFVIE